MKYITCLLLAMVLPVALVAAQDVKKSAAPVKPVVISSYRVIPKPGHAKQLETALSAHAKKYHKGDFAWRIGQVMSRPEAGAYHITEGPSSWTAIDGRGDLGAEHTKDYETNVLPHVEKSLPDRYLTYQTALSTVGATQRTNKVAITHYVQKPGSSGAINEGMRKWKAIYEKLGLTVAVWRTSWSGEITYVLVHRLKNGFRHFDDDAPEFRKACDELFGTGGYAKLQQSSADKYSKIWSELIEFKPELASK